MSGKTVKEFLIEQMIEHGYSALYCQDADNYGCFLDDFMPCGGDPMGCEMAYKKRCEFDPEKCNDTCEGRYDSTIHCATTIKPEDIK
jgi:hypothetical protein